MTDLELLAVSPTHQRRGVGSQLVQWGTTRADADGLEAYLDATPKGAPIYKRLGFEGRTPVRMPPGYAYGDDYDILPMVRKPVGGGKRGVGQGEGEGGGGRGGSG